MPGQHSRCGAGARGAAAVCAVASAVLLAAAPAVADIPDYRPEQWGLDTVGAQEVWEDTRGKGTLVALPGSAVDETHPDLRDAVRTSTEFAGADAGDLDTGTGMAGVIAANGHGIDAEGGVLGVAPEARVLAVPTDGPERLADAIGHSVDEGAQVIVLPGPEGGDREAEQAAVDRAVRLGAVVIAPAGDRAAPEAAEPPAPYAGVLAVGAVDGDLRLTPTSGRQEGVGLLAPGAQVEALSADTGFTQADGTEFAAAFAGGAAALIRTRYPQLGPEQVEEALVSGARAPAEAGAGYGAGVLDVPAAMERAAETASGIPRIDERLLQEQEDGEPLPWWVWWAAGAGVLLAALVTLVWWVRRTTSDPYGMAATRRENEERIIRERAAEEASRPRRRGGRRRKGRDAPRPR